MDVVVPFAGTPAALARLLRRLAALQTGPADTITVVDNRPEAQAGGHAGVRVVAARERQSSYYARNRGAEAGHSPWLVFLDADVEAPPDLLSRYFAVAPGDDTAILAGAVTDKPVDGAGMPSIAARYAYARQAMDQQHTLGQRRPYAQTANCAIRRDAFKRERGFRETIRSGGDADLCFRLLAAGYHLEYRPAARADHHGRTTLVKLLRQRARHGSGAAWLETLYPGFAPNRSLLRPSARLLRRCVRSSLRLASGQGPVDPFEFLDALTDLAFNAGGLLSNEVDHPSSPDAAGSAGPSPRRPPSWREVRRRLPFAADPRLGTR